MRTTRVPSLPSLRVLEFVLAVIVAVVVVAFCLSSHRIALTTGVLDDDEFWFYCQSVLPAVWRSRFFLIVEYSDSIGHRLRQKNPDAIFRAKMLLQLQTNSAGDQPLFLYLADLVDKCKITDFDQQQQTTTTTTTNINKHQPQQQKQQQQQTTTTPNSNSSNNKQHPTTTINKKQHWQQQQQLQLTTTANRTKQQQQQH